MLPHQGGWSVSEAILTAGQATADNLPAGLAEIQYMMRTPTVAMASPFLDERSCLIAPEDTVAILRRDLAPSQTHSTSDDYTDMCWHVPTARLYIARPALKAPAGYSYPNWAMNALGGIPATIDPVVQTAARELSASALQLPEDTTARDAALAEFETRTGGGVGGTNWAPPLCDYDPPIHFRWPEYVETQRGRDWWIPSTMPAD